MLSQERKCKETTLLTHRKKDLLRSLKKDLRREIQHIKEIIQMIQIPKLEKQLH